MVMVLWTDGGPGLVQKHVVGPCEKAPPELFREDPDTTDAQIPKNSGHWQDYHRRKEPS